MKITIFTLDLTDKNDDEKNKITAPLHDFCITSWHKLVTYLEGSGYEAEIVIYTKNSPEYQIVENEIIKNWENPLKSICADVFRMYILSSKPNHLWLDWDIFIRDSFTMNLSEMFFMPSWYFIYNSNNIDFFKPIYNYYKKMPQFQYLYDKEVTEFLSKNKIINYEFNELDESMLIHLCFLDNVPVKGWYFIYDQERHDYFVKEHKQDRHNYQFIVPTSTRQGYIKGLYNEKELIKFLLSNFDLSLHSKAVLEDALK